MDTDSNNGAIFVSHATADKEIASKFIKTLRECLGLPLEVFFYSSNVRTGVEPGKEFVRSIRERIRSAKVVISLVSSDFLASDLCWAETGATWGLEKQHWNILTLPGLRPGGLRDFLNAFQAIEITNRDALVQLVTQIANATGAQARWDGSKWLDIDFLLNEFIDGLPHSRAHTATRTAETLETKKQELQDLRQPYSRGLSFLLASSGLRFVSRTRSALPFQRRQWFSFAQTRQSLVARRTRPASER
jgi:hypothetical protein